MVVIFNRCIDAAFAKSLAASVGGVAPLVLLSPGSLRRFGFH
jgi:hypothetical protein